MMTLDINPRGFQQVLHTESNKFGRDGRLIGAWPENPDKLYVGYDHELNRAEVVALIVHLQRWVDTGAL